MRHGVRVMCRSQGGSVLDGRIELEKFGYGGALNKLVWGGK